jgi:uncharacterized protein (DUF1697 family)
MPRYVALLRGVSPMNASMADLRQCFLAAGFTDVRTVRSSGNVVFTSRAATWPSLEKKAEKAMSAALGRSFATIVRPTAYLQQLLASEPFAAFALAPTANRVVTFVRQEPGEPIALPIERDGVRILKRIAGEVFTAYERDPKGPVFMVLLERTFGKHITTRTLDTVHKCAQA